MRTNYIQSQDILAATHTFKEGLFVLMFRLELDEGLKMQW